MERDGSRILIAGGGIAGLTAALCLARRGWRVELFERSEGFESDGGGLQLSPNALSVLDRLGLMESLLRIASIPRRIRIASGVSGGVLSSLPLGEAVAERFGQPYLTVHRGGFHALLLGACRDCPGVSVRSGARVEDAESRGEEGVRVIVGESPEDSCGDSLADSPGISPGDSRADSGGDSLSSEVFGQALIGADGVRSVVREKALKAPPARFGGAVAWRAAIPSASLPESWPLDEIRLWLSPRVHAVCYGLGSSDLLNVAILAADDVPFPALRETLSQWKSEFPLLLDLPAEWIRWPIFVSPASGRWTLDRIALAGDAAHASPPFAAQGAAMGIEDGFILARCLSESVSIPSGLRAYEEARRPRIARARRQAEANRRLYHLGWPLSAARNLGMKLLGSERLLARQNWLYEWKPPE